MYFPSYSWKSLFFRLYPRKLRQCRPVPFVCIVLPQQGRVRHIKTLLFVRLSFRKFTLMTNMFSKIALGAALAKASRPLIYGGGKLGLMGAVSQAVIDNGGFVTGVSPIAMVAGSGQNMEMAGVSVDKVSNREPPPHPNRTNIVVDSMHDRKMELARRADGGFVALPGGYGTFEEVSSRSIEGRKHVSLTTRFLVA